jgi:1,4-dihydroxy-2-naphthoyl-CoA hydrolase
MTIATDGSVDPARLARLEERPHRFFTLIGGRFTYVSKERLEAELPVREGICNQGGNLHGGAFMSFADHVGAMATIVNIPPGCRTTTLESKTNFFAPVMEGDVARAECLPLHRGRTTMVWQTRITRGDGRLAAIVTQTQMVIAPQDATPAQS